MSFWIEIIALHSFSVRGNIYCRSLSSLTEHPWSICHLDPAAPLCQCASFLPSTMSIFFFLAGPMLNILRLWTPNLFDFGVTTTSGLTSQSTDWAQKIKQKRNLGLLRQVMVMQCFDSFSLLYGLMGEGFASPKVLKTGTRSNSYFLICLQRKMRPCI